MVTQHLKQREREGKINLNENNWIFFFNSKLAELYIVGTMVHWKDLEKKKKKQFQKSFSHTLAKFILAEVCKKWFEVWLSIKK